MAKRREGGLGGRCCKAMTTTLNRKKKEKKKKKKKKKHRHSAFKSPWVSDSEAAKRGGRRWILYFARDVTPKRVRTHPRCEKSTIETSP